MTIYPSDLSGYFVVAAWADGGRAVAKGPRAGERSRKPGGADRAPALAEVKRLTRHGHDRRSAIAAVKRMGWAVEE